MEKSNLVFICCVGISNLSFQDSLSQISTSVKQQIPSFIVTPNVDHIIRLQKDVEFREVYDDAALVLTDGVPLLWAARFLGTPLKEKISGSDLFPKLCEVASQKGWRLFFLGGREGATVKAAEVLRQKHPSIQIVGTYCPPFGFEHDEKENSKVIEMIKKARADILFVGVGTPKQEKWIYTHKDQYQVPVSIGIGASFDFLSEMVKRAPAWMQKVGLEWFWRLMMEPKRLWKRYLVDDMQFFWLVLKQKFKLN